MAKKSLSTTQQAALLDTLQQRFEKHMNRHKGVKWDTVANRLTKKPAALWSLFQMEETGGEPDLVRINKKTGELLFMDCAPESPKDRRSFCFDRASLNSRKTFKPKNSALDAAKEMGITILTEEDYRFLQALGEFDTKTSSWIATPAEIRKRGGALFCDRRYDHVFTYHNGAESYYAARGFRGSLLV